MKRLLAVTIVLALNCGGNARQAPADVRQSLRADWQSDVICYREQDWCACCYGSNNSMCYDNQFASFTFVPCKIPEKMGLRIY